MWACAFAPDLVLILGVLADLVLPASQLPGRRIQQVQGLLLVAFQPGEADAQIRQGRKLFLFAVPGPEGVHLCLELFQGRVDQFEGFEIAFVEYHRQPRRQPQGQLVTVQGRFQVGLGSEQ